MSSQNSDLREKYVRERRPAVRVEVDLRGLIPRAPVMERPRLTAGQRAFGLDMTDWAPALLHAWYTDRLTGEWLAEVEVEVSSSNRRAEVRLRTLVRAEHVRRAT